MKRIHFVVPYQSAAMRRLSLPLINELAKIYTVTTSAEVDDSADLNYHIPWHTMIKHEKSGSGKHAIAYTHCNVGGESELLDACERADLITCMSFTGRNELVKMGVDPRKLWVIYSAADQFNFRKRLIGIVGYPQPNGRKRESLIIDLAWNYDLTPFQFVFVGTGWTDVVAKLNSLGVAAAEHDAQSDDMIKLFYQQIDLLLVTGYREGGPLPLLEAMASGSNVLSPRFGYASDLLDDERLYDTVDELADKLQKFAEPFINQHKLSRAWRWQDYCSEHALVFGRLLNESVDLYPEYGASRYMQLLDIIEQEKASNIVEIGTWNGNRAIQMIQEAAKIHPINEVYYQGFDLFESQTGEQFRRELSKMGWEKNIVEKRINATGANIELVAGETKYTLAEMADGDVYFVDGGHSEKTIENDGGYVLELLSDDSVVIFDDYYHKNKPDGVGCNKFVDALDANRYEITHLPNQTVADDGRVIGMVKVRKVKYADLRIQRWRTCTGSNTLYAGVPVYSVPDLRQVDAPSPTIG